jgi:hypothetical protein
MSKLSDKLTGCLENFMLIIDKEDVQRFFENTYGG